MKLKTPLLILNLLSLFIVQHFSMAQSTELPQQENSQEQLLIPKLLVRKNQTRGVYWPVIGSMFFPGLDQWIEQQHKTAAVYSGGAYLGLQMSYAAMNNLEKTGVTKDKDYFVNLASRNDDLRNLQMGSHIYSTMGYFSAYHSFRNAVLSYEPYGKFSFLPKDEKPTDLMLAPFDFSHLASWRTAIPLGALIVALSQELKSDIYQHNNYNIKDQLYATGFSYGAGVGEEMMFRGWLMPMAYESWGSDWGANLFTSTVFALGHISPSNKTPVAQLLMGYYFGYLTLANNWSLREAIFVHTWWDILIFSANYLDNSRTKDASIFLPLLSLTF